MEAASLVFLVTFMVVNIIAWREMETWRWIPAIAVVMSFVVGFVLVARLAVNAPVPLAVLAGLSVFVFVARPAILARVQTEGGE